jgi:hypothetical protein
MVATFSSSTTAFSSSFTLVFFPFLLRLFFLLRLTGKISQQQQVRKLNYHPNNDFDLYESFLPFTLSAPAPKPFFFLLLSLLRFVVNCHSSHLTMGKRDAREKKMPI